MPGLFDAAAVACPESEGGAPPGAPGWGDATGSFVDGGGGGAINGGEAAIGGCVAACTLPMVGTQNGSSKSQRKQTGKLRKTI